MKKVLAPKLPVAGLPVPPVPSSKVTCVVCGTECWSSDGSDIPGVTLSYICMPDFLKRLRAGEV
jgi:hypothetical protein